MKANVLDRAASLLGFAGIFVAGTLTLADIAGKDVPCGGTNDCSIVAQHPSSHLLGISNAQLGLALYVVLTCLAISRLALGGPAKRNAVVGFTLSMLGTAFSAYLTYIAVAEIKHTCLWCLASALIITVTFLVHAARLTATFTDGRDPMLMPFVATGAALCLGGLGFVGSNLVQPRSAVKSPISADVYNRHPLVPKDPNSFGNERAPVTVVEFADMTCPHCKEMLPKMKSAVSQSNGKLRLIMRFFPLPGDQHQMGLPAAILAEYCATKGKFWDFVEAVFGAGQNPTIDSLYDTVKSLGLDPKDAEAQLSNRESVARQRNLADVNASDAYDLIYTPTFFVLLPGQPPIIALQTDIEQILASDQVRQAMTRG